MMERLRAASCAWALGLAWSAATAVAQPTATEEDPVTAAPEQPSAEGAERPAAENAPTDQEPMNEEHADEDHAVEEHAVEEHAEQEPTVEEHADPAPTEQEPAEQEPAAEAAAPRALDEGAEFFDGTAQTNAPAEGPDAVVREASVLAQDSSAEETSPDTASRRERRKGPDRYQLSVLAGARFRDGSSYSVLHDTTAVPTAGLAIGADFVKIGPLRFAAEFHWTTEPPGDVGFQGAEAELRSHDVELAVRARYDVLTWLGLHARIGGGFTQATFELDAGSQPELESRSRAPFATFGAGLTVRTPPGVIHRVSLGATLEAGYRAAAPLSIRAQPERATTGDDTPIPTAQVDLGELGRHAPYVLGSFFVRY